MKVESDLIELENNFIELHKEQLKSCGLPESHWIGLFHKLKDEVIIDRLVFMMRAFFCCKNCIFRFSTLAIIFKFV